MMQKPDGKQTERSEVTRRRFLGVAGGFAGATVIGGARTPAFGRVASSQKSAAPFVCADFGGQTTNAWNKSVRALFTKRTGVSTEAVVIDYGKWVAQIQSGHVLWSWVDAEGFIPYQYQNLLVDIPYGKIGITKADLYPIREAVTPKAVLQYLSSYVIGYRKNRTGPRPHTWAEFFDVKNIPGKRAVYNYPYGILEIALMADGVPFNKVYPIDVKRAFKKLDTIKSDTIFWNTGAQSEQLLSSGQVDFEIGWNNRFGYLVQAGAPVGIEYNQNLQIKDYSTISLHEPNYELCVEFLKAAMDPQAQAKFAELSGNAPSVRAAYKYLDAKTKARMSTNPVYLKQAVGAINDNWWGSHINSITNQWNAWV